ncbi:MAG TPA: SDR family oxidoreductase [Solirubrobacteraceae bacterium]|nr:SDR family oxidoreductase [Solirubrobacteraceae bacterium]
MAQWTGVAGKQVLITGATRGIGLAAVQALAEKGARLAIVARSDTRAAEASERIARASQAGWGPAAPVDVLVADLASQASVRRLAAEVLERYPRLDVLINNAGAVHRDRQLTEDGIELTWAVNQVAPFLLTTLLLGRLEQSAPARIVTTSSDAHRGAHIPFDDLDAEDLYRRRSSRVAAGFARYGQTKLANILLTAELARRLEGTSVTANCFHPGLVATGFNRNNGTLMSLAMTLIRPFTRTPKKGAETLVWLADSPDPAGEQGGYFVDKRRVAPSAEAQDSDAARRLWAITEEQVRQSAAAR